MPQPPNAYIIVDNSLGTNEKFLEVEEACYLEVVGLYVLVLGYCDRASSDGRISRKAVTGIRGLAPGRDDLVDEMRRVRLLTGDERLTVKDYTEWQRSRAEKQAATQRGREAAAARWHPKRNASGNAKRNAKCNAEREKDRTLSHTGEEKGVRSGPIVDSEACEMCEGFGFVMTENDKAAPCPECRGKEATNDE